MNDKQTETKPDRTAEALRLFLHAPREALVACLDLLERLRDDAERDENFCGECGPMDLPPLGTHHPECVAGATGPLLEALAGRAPAPAIPPYVPPDPPDESAGADDEEAIDALLWDRQGEIDVCRFCFFVREGTASAVLAHAARCSAVVLFGRVRAKMVAERQRFRAFSVAVANLAAETIDSPSGRHLAALCATHGVAPPPAAVSDGSAE